jgi:uncharacterized protein YkwD
MLSKILKVFIVFWITGIIPACAKTEVEIAQAPVNPDKELLLQLVNEYRTAGCKCGTKSFPPVEKLVWSDTLTLAAKDHSLDMDMNKFFRHKGSDGSSVSDRVEKYNYIWSAVGENIAQGYPTEEAVIRGWIKSPGHCENIMNASFREMGIATSGVNWTQVFGTKK